MCAKNILLISVMILFAANFSLASSSQTINIALIADKSSGLDKSPLVSLLEVELSQKEGIQLLERAAIDKILEEQQLSAAGFLDRNNIIKIGKLLRAEAFIILSLEDQIQDANDLVRVRVSETAHGLRLLDYFEQSEKSNPKESVDNIVQKLQSVLNKISQPDDKLIPVGIVDIHRVELGEQYKMLERTLPTMLSVRLSLEPQIIMLEREDLKVLLDEKLRTEGQDSEFWNSAILIEGYLQPNDGRLEMHLNLKQSDGVNKNTFVVQVEPNEPSVAIAKATTEIIQNLQNSPPAAKWNPELEAEQFYKQGKMLSNHQRYEEALPLFETAHALQPQNVYYRGAMFARIWEIRRKIDKTLINNETGINKYEKPGQCPYSDMEIVDMVSILVRQIRDNYEKGLLSTDQIYFHFANTLGHVITMNQGYFSSAVSIATAKIREINRENRKIWVDTVEDAIRKQISGNNSAQNRNYIETAVSLAWIKSDEPNDVIANLKKAINEYLISPEFRIKISSDSERKEIYERSFLQYSDNPIFSSVYMPKSSHLKGSWDETEKLMQEYLEELAEINDPVIGIQSKLLVFSDYQSYVDDLRKEFKTSKLNNSKYVTEALIGLFEKIYYIKNSRNITIEESINIWEELCNYIIYNNDTDTLTSLLLISSNAPFTRLLESINTHANKATSVVRQTLLYIWQF
jgi:hypothetical protein